MAPWSSGQDASLSRWNQGFDSPGSHTKEIRLDFLFLLQKFRSWNNFFFHFTIVNNLQF